MIGWRWASFRMGRRIVKFGELQPLTIPGRTLPSPPHRLPTLIYYIYSFHLLVLLVTPLIRNAHRFGSYCIYSPCLLALLVITFTRFTRYYAYSQCSSLRELITFTRFGRYCIYSLRSFIPFKNSKLFFNFSICSPFQASQLSDKICSLMVWRNLFMA